MINALCYLSYVGIMSLNATFLQAMKKDHVGDQSIDEKYQFSLVLHFNEVN